MAKAGNGDLCDVWLWDGAMEYEGVLVKLEENSFCARLREVRRGAGAGTLGRRVAAASLDLHRTFAGRRFLAHFTGTVEGTLFEAGVDSVQPSSDSAYDYLLSGRFGTLDEQRLEMLRKISAANAETLRERRVS